MDGKPLILYLTVHEKSMGFVLGQHDKNKMKKRTIYYLSKKFTKYESKYIRVKSMSHCHPKAANKHYFILLAIDYFTKWVKKASYDNVTKGVV